MYKLNDGYEYEIRHAKVEDAKSILDFIDCVSGESDNLTFGKGEFNLSLEKEISYLENLAGEDNQIMLVAVYEDKILSTLSYGGGHRSRVRHCGEFGISVRKEYWGNGIGLNMIKELFDWAKKSKYCEKINLRVREDNIRAIRLYEYLGFEKEGVILKDMKINGEFINCVFMGKSIKK